MRRPCLMEYSYSIYHRNCYNTYACMCTLMAITKIWWTSETLACLSTYLTQPCALADCENKLHLLFDFALWDSILSIYSLFRKTLFYKNGSNNKHIQSLQTSRVCAAVVDDFLTNPDNLPYLGNLIIQFKVLFLWTQTEQFWIIFFRKTTMFVCGLKEARILDSIQSIGTVKSWDCQKHTGRCMIDSWVGN